MGEYDRRQKKQESRAIAYKNEKSRSIVDNRMSTVSQTQLVDSIRKKNETIKMKHELRGNLYQFKISEYSSIRNSDMNIIQCEDDPVEDLLWEDAADTESLKFDVDNAMKRLKPVLLSWLETKEDLWNSLIAQSINPKTQRERPLYSNRTNTVEDLRSWDESWTIERTAGLLLDLGYYLRSEIDEMAIMNSVMGTGRPESRDERQASNFPDRVKGRKWGKLLPQNTRIQSGISATTGNLLRLLKTFDKDVQISFNEVGAIMLSVFRFWNTKDAKLSGLNEALVSFRNNQGLFHTATEIWSIYTYVYLTQHLLNTDESTYSSETD